MIYLWWWVIWVWQNISKNDKNTNNHNKNKIKSDGADNCMTMMNNYANDKGDNECNDDADKIW